MTTPTPFYATPERPLKLSFRVNSELPYIHFEIKGDDLQMDPGDGTGYLPIRQKSGGVISEKTSCNGEVKYSYHRDFENVPDYSEHYEKDQYKLYNSKTSSYDKLFEFKIMGTIKDFRVGTDYWHAEFGFDWRMSNLCGVRF